VIPLSKFDGFAIDALEVRHAVVRSKFGTHKGPDGADYTGISLLPVPNWIKRISEVVGHPIVSRLSCFRVNLAKELPHSWVHSDGICAQYASVLYLNLPEQCAGGTAFWRHKELGMDRLPSKEALTSRGIDADAFYKQMDREWKELKWWEQTQFVPMKFNRFVTYPTAMFHSRYPFEGFGQDPSSGRLIWACFYDIEGGDR
jgi:hypothetical protein